MQKMTRLDPEMNKTEIGVNAFRMKWYVVIQGIVYTDERPQCRLEDRPVLRQKKARRHGTNEL
jgi:hypothetical protein